MNRPTENRPTELIDCYIAAWNETDGPRRRALIEQTWTEDATYVDPMMQGEGYTGIDAMIQSVQAQFPGHRFRRTGRIDAYRGYIRFAWGLGTEGAAALAGGADFEEIVDGRLHAVTGILDFAPVAAAQ